MNIAIIKYNAGNVQSVQYALERLGYGAVVTDNYNEIKNADKVIFPGVGNAYSAMESLKEKKLDEVIRQLTQPVLGICVGMQLLCTHSEENDTTGLGIIDLNVKKFVSEKNNFKIPQMGWNNIYNLSS
ncbi:MAG: Imidazole glycerol phosphate synthase subunit hisH, partial [Chitinophagaceae bacterium]|nr:Imidazole glycerol phosphate synthase subunit hisH [Chitinophagaceae bacterium]